MSHDEAIAFIATMESRAEVAPSVDLSIENWDALFGKDGVVITPIGQVKMGDNQFTKMMREDRHGKLGMVKPTLENPDVIIEAKSRAKDGDITERGSSYIFVKAFTKPDGSRYYYFTSVTVSKAGHEVVVSTQEKSRNRLLRLLSEEDVIWRTPNDATTTSAEGQGLDYAQPSEAETATKGSGITPQNTSSENKVINKQLTLQENGEESVGNKGADTEVGNAEDAGNGRQDSSDKADTDKITPVGESDFGLVYDQFRGDAQGAIRQLMKMEDGEALGALHHDEIGDIDLVWGEAGTRKSDGYGLAKLVKFHPEVLDNLQGILDSMHITERTENRVQLENDEYQAAVRLTWNGEEKLWLLTAFKKKETSEPTNSRTDVDSYLKGKSDDTATRQNSDVSVDKVINKTLTLQENGEESVGNKGVTPLSEGTLEAHVGLNDDETNELLSRMEGNTSEIPQIELNPTNWIEQFGENGMVATPVGEVKMGENQIAKLFEKGRSEQFGMIKPTLENPQVVIEVPSEATDEGTERASSLLFIKTFKKEDGTKVYYFKSVTVKKDGLEVSVSSHYDRAKRAREALKKGKLLYRFDGGAQTERHPADVSVTTSPESMQGKEGNTLQTAAQKPHGGVSSESKVNGSLSNPQKNQKKLLKTMVQCHFLSGLLPPQPM